MSSPAWLGPSIAHKSRPASSQGQIRSSSLILTWVIGVLFCKATVTTLYEALHIPTLLCCGYCSSAHRGCATEYKAAQKTKMADFFPPDFGSWNTDVQNNYIEAQKAASEARKAIAISEAQKAASEAQKAASEAQKPHRKLKSWNMPFSWKE